MRNVLASFLIVRNSLTGSGALSRGTLGNVNDDVCKCVVQACNNSLRFYGLTGVLLRAGGLLGHIDHFGFHRCADVSHFTGYGPCGEKNSRQYHCRKQGGENFLFQHAISDLHSIFYLRLKAQAAVVIFSQRL